MLSDAAIGETWEGIPLADGTEKGISVQHSSMGFAVQHGRQ